MPSCAATSMPVPKIPIASSVSRGTRVSTRFAGIIDGWSSKNHPDRLIARGVPAEFVAIANNRLASLNGAFESIERDMRVS